MPRTAVVIPALNEARSIGSVVLQARACADIVLVVDDGSHDATAEVARLAGGQVVAHERNLGKGAALRTGIEAALKLDSDRIVLIDADGQHDAREIPRLLAGLEGGADLVVGSRRVRGDGAPTRSRRFGRSVLDGATNLVGGMAVDDTQSGYRAMTAAAAARLLPRVGGMGVESRMLLDAARLGIRIVEVDVTEHYPRNVKPHVRPLKHAASVLRSVLGFVREKHPLAIFGGAGLLLLLVGAFLGWQTAYAYYGAGTFWPGKAMMAALAMTLGSIGIVAGLIMDFLAARLDRR